jgi:hypothetical protein
MVQMGYNSKHFWRIIQKFRAALLRRLAKEMQVHSRLVQKKIKSAQLWMKTTLQ